VSYRPPRKAPSDRSHLERLVQALSVEEGIAADRLRRWVSAQVLLGALSRDGDDRRRFLLKGGVAMELRLRLRARATKDIDIVVFAETEDDLIDTLQAALEHHLDGLADRGASRSELLCADQTATLVSAPGSPPVRARRMTQLSRSFELDADDRPVAAALELLGQADHAAQQHEAIGVALALELPKRGGVGLSLAVPAGDQGHELQLAGLEAGQSRALDQVADEHRRVDEGDRAAHRLASSSSRAASRPGASGAPPSRCNETASPSVPAASASG